MICWVSGAQLALLATNLVLYFSWITFDVFSFLLFLVLFIACGKGNGVWQAKPTDMAKERALCWSLPGVLWRWANNNALTMCTSDTRLILLHLWQGVLLLAGRER